MLDLRIKIHLGPIISLFTYQHILDICKKRRSTKKKVSKAGRDCRHLVISENIALLPRANTWHFALLNQDTKLVM